MKLSEIVKKANRLLEFHGDMESIVICRSLCSEGTNKFILENINVESNMEAQAVIIDIEIYID